MPKVRTLKTTLRGAEAQWRQYKGEHTLVQTVVAMKGNAVVHASNSDAPEFVPSEVLTADAAMIWNNTAVVLDHPGASAKDPKVLDERGMGTVFNARGEDGDLVFDVYLSRSDAERIGGEVLEAYKDLAAGKNREVSIGVIVETEDVEGEHEGKAYSRRWYAVVHGDHFAVLNSESKGACSNAMGCGLKNNLGAAVAHRALQKAQARGGDLAAHWRTLTGNTVDLREEFRAHVANMDDRDIYWALWDLLAAEVEGFDMLESVSTLKGEVVYSVTTSTYLTYYMRGFKVANGGTVTLKGTATPVELVTEFRPVDNPVRVPNRFGLFNANDERKEPEMKKPDGTEETAEEPRDCAGEDTKETVEEKNCGSADTVNVPRAEWEEFQTFAPVLRDLQAEHEARKESLVAQALEMQGENGAFTKCELSAMTTVRLEKLLAFKAAGQGTETETPVRNHTRKPARFSAPSPPAKKRERKKRNHTNIYAADFDGSNPVENPPN